MKKTTISKGYNEKNPGEPQGAFKTDNLAQKDSLSKKSKKERPAVAEKKFHEKK